MHNKTIHFFKNNFIPFYKIIIFDESKYLKYVFNDYKLSN